MDFIQKKGLLTIAKESVFRGVSLGIIFVALGIVSALLLQAPYKASVDFMLSSTQEGQDYYTATRSAEYMGRVLGEVIYSESFVKALTDTGIVDENFLPRDKKMRLEEWSKMLTVKKNPELGLINISFAGSSEREVSKIAQAVIIVLNENGNSLLGAGSEKIKVQLLSGPIVEGNPSSSLLSLIAVVGLAIGFFLSFSLRLIREEFRTDRFLS
ncbi:MAG: hypothetical protein GW815_00255 [Candidatus Moranbacteria bacterium]|nr:hypothetical protein [Candidatus Moranbacteria bacterium]OIQ01679.1 MAG: hypothetical protein AUK58_04115 [Candidatus Moranbacteria bacterium CG2_30_41_165]PIP25915.1 MAG: hypothetical protein COX32_00860 [Candidatus Moranbacteria bacterium CG23_combo_of_CG06-09_8_20_14_all_41_28]PIV86555.1 MAG: hypothetical protein COW50_00825 [Candidatus Moranbacteria bacterium CG17_big_fil_post_rev_8_21_14_2_50_41_107]PIW94277.1 MAG: hypothetical protein COZ86_01830 [Candidatus Moranbacteria bacterium CG_